MPWQVQSSAHTFHSLCGICSWNSCCSHLLPNDILMPPILAFGMRRRTVTLELHSSAATPDNSFTCFRFIFSRFTGTPFIEWLGNIFRYFFLPKIMEICKSMSMAKSKLQKCVYFLMRKIYFGVCVCVRSRRASHGPRMDEDIDGQRHASTRSMWKQTNWFEKFWTKCSKYTMLMRCSHVCELHHARVRMVNIGYTQLLNVFAHNALVSIIVRRQKRTHIRAWSAHNSAQYPLNTKKQEKEG